MKFTSDPASQKNIAAISFQKCWAKTDKKGNPGISVQTHLISVAEVCSVLARHLPHRLHLMAAFAVYAAALHDVGKVSPGFQLKYFRKKLEELVPEFKEKTLSAFCDDHSHTGAAALWNCFGRHALSPPPVSLISAMHHGALKRPLCASDETQDFGGSNWSRERQNLIREMEKLYPRPNLSTIPPALLNFISGMVTISDWIGSDETFFPPGKPLDRKNAARTAQKAITDCGLIPPEILPNLTFKKIFGFPPKETQSAFANIVTGPGAYVLEAPTGMGKTEAALFAAYGLMSSGLASGIFFGLPTRLTSDRIFHRVRHFIDQICSETRPPKLAHGTAWLSEYNIGGKELSPGNSWFSPRKRALLHPFVVGTIDQALLGILKVKHHFVRTFALAGKVVILDEVHSYDGYTGSLLDELVQTLVELGCTVLILSATLTAERRAAFFKNKEMPATKAYPLISGPDNIVSCLPPPEKIHKISTMPPDDTAVAETAVNAARHGNCVLCIANTVAKAQSWHDAVLAATMENAFPIGLIHSKFPGFQRTALEDLWMERLGKDGDRPSGCILIGTQVVEQSVDIDADYLITELAPTDMLIQRLGRQWRHQRDVRPGETAEVILVTGDAGPAEDPESLYAALGETNCKVYAPWVLLNTWKIWHPLKEISLPRDIRMLLEQTYAAPSRFRFPMEKQLYEEFQTMKKSLGEKAQGAMSTAGHMPTQSDGEQCATRYSDLPTTQVLLVKSLTRPTGKEVLITLANDVEVTVNQWHCDFEILRELHRNLMNVPSYLVALPESSSPDYLKKYFYGPLQVMVWDQRSGGRITIEGKKTDFFYAPTKGLFRRTGNPSRSKPDYPSDWQEIKIFDKARFDW